MLIDCSSVTCVLLASADGRDASPAARPYGYSIEAAGVSKHALKVAQSPLHFRTITWSRRDVRTIYSVHVKTRYENV